MSLGHSVSPDEAVVNKWSAVLVGDDGPVCRVTGVRWAAGERRVRSSVSVPGSEQRPRQGRRRCKFLQVQRESVHRAMSRRLRARRSPLAHRRGRTPLHAPPYVK